MAFRSEGVDGFAYAPGQARRLPARLTHEGGQTRLHDQDGALLTTGAAQRQNRVAGGMSMAEFDNGWRFETLDHAALDAQIGAARGDWLRALERPSWRLVFAVLGTAGAVVMIWRFGLDLLVAAAIAMTPAPMVRSLDIGNMAALDRTLAQPTQLTEDKQTKLQAIFDDIATAAPPPDFGTYRLEFRRIRGVGPNAFALPGGTIVLTDELVRRFDDPDVIAGILGHEAAHVAENHGLRQLYRNLSVVVLLALIVGDVGPVLEDLMLEGSVLLSLGYSREHEREADRVGMRIAQDAGYDPEGLIVFFDALQKRGIPEGPGWLSTHPHSHERAETLRGLLE